MCRVRLVTTTKILYDINYFTYFISVIYIRVTLHVIRFNNGHSTNIKKAIYNINYLKKLAPFLKTKTLLNYKI